MTQPRATMLERYEPSAFEAEWYKRWEMEGAFHAKPDPSKPPFVISMPPPNITGRAHMGHGSTYTPMDILTRYHRMRGYNAVWLPGQDHAAIATQNVIEKELAAEGLTRYDLGPDKFRERAEAWRQKYGHLIYEQFRALGFGPDWQRDRYTMDAGLSRAVTKVFIDLYREGLIYRGTRLVNWCPHCQSTLSDSEVEREPAAGRLYYVRYDGADGSQGVVVATTRPETIFADVAVAVNPRDPRYSAMIGSRVLRPLSPIPLPVIADPAVEPTFGSGALKITPGHDQTDAEVGERHGLEAKSVIDTDARMAGEVEPDFLGLDRFAARALAVKLLRERGLLVREEEHEIAVGTCYRCETIVEPLLSLQWFVRMKSLAQPALESTQNGRLSFFPARYARTYESWLENIKDWCISRQIWLGHRMPVWYCANGHVIVTQTAPASCDECHSDRVTQAADTLDTWFSSALWPFSILGWPDPTRELEAWYPNQLMVTGREIIFLWVARMVMLGIHFLGREPFAKVLITPLIMDEQGRKMSKSLGNSLDPMDLVARYGADATRLAIVGQMHEGQDVRFSVERCDDARKFGNKVWQAVRFALQKFAQLDSAQPPPALPPRAQLTLADRWILDALAATIKKVERAAESYDFSEWAQALYTFFWNQLCDVYIEIAKDQAATRPAVLHRALTSALLMLHPITPFLTEELWHHLPHSVDRIEQAGWPFSSGWEDAVARDKMTMILDFVQIVLSLRAVPKLRRDELREISLVGAQESLVSLLQEESGIIRTLGYVSGIRALRGDGRPSYALSKVMGSVEVLLPVDAAFIDKERMALRKDREKTRSEIEALERKLSSAGFTEKAPKDVVEKEKVRLQELHARLARSSERLASL